MEWERETEGSSPGRKNGAIKDLERRNRTIRFLRDIQLPRPPNRNNKESGITCKTLGFKIM